MFGRIRITIFSKKVCIDMKSNVKFTIVCPICKTVCKGKPIVAGFVEGCKCGYKFTHEEKDKAVERVKRLREEEKRRE